MTVYEALSEEECYLAALFDDPSGIDLAEFSWRDDTPGRPDSCYRVYDYQWTWYRNESTYQIDQAGRSLGKSQGILMRAFAFPFNFPGQEMLITAPELNHLDPITTKVEAKFVNGPRFARAMLPPQKGGGVKHQPQFQATFLNGSVMMGRLPNRDGRGVKGSIGAGTLVLTRRGLIPVEDVVAGDEVVTHQGRWRPVEHVVEYFNDQVIEVNGGGHRGFVMSQNHRMLGRRLLSTDKQARRLGVPEFLIPGDLDDTRYFFGSPTRFEPSIAPSWATPELLWLAGRYVADGYLRRQNGKTQFNVVCESHEVSDLEARFRVAGLTPHSHQRSNGTWEVRSRFRQVAVTFRDEFGELAAGKVIPTWLLGAPEVMRQSFLDGYLGGDGHWAELKRRWEFSSASKALTIGIILLAQTLGWKGSYSWVDPQVSQICGTALKAKPQRAHRGHLTKHGVAIVERNVKWQRVRKVSPAEPQLVYDLHVKDDHSYIADGLISHNQHPLVLEADEMQDYPKQGWIELIETMKAGVPGAQWRCHGVSRGVRDMYYRMTSNEADVPFYVHRYMGMHRPTWNEEERRNKIAIYGGSRDNPDYKRNIYGEHGDVSNPVFVLARLMACVRQHESTWATEYNESVYNLVKIEAESLEGRPIESFLTFPRNHIHDSYTSYWAGMDLGFTSDPSELLVFGQIRKTIAGEATDILRLLSRIHLMRISAADQERVIAAVLGFYGPRLRALSMDKTGVGLPVWQNMDGKPGLRERIRGYGFSEKRAVDFDDRELVGKETPLDAMIEKNVIEFATGKLREYVDAKMIELPYDTELLTEFQGQVVLYSRDEGSGRGQRTKYGGGSFHTLDAAKLMILGKELEAIEALQRERFKREPVLEAFW